MSRVKQLQGSAAKVRKQPVSDSLVNLLEAVAEETDTYFEITSGGQTRGPFKKKGVDYKGSTRHDNGQAADLKAYVLDVDGTKKYLDFTTTEGNKKWSEIVSLAAAGGATGIGAGTAYMGNYTVHIGYGVQSTWGAEGRAVNAPEWLKTAVAEGRKIPPMNIPDVASKLAVTAPVPVSMSASLAASRKVINPVVPTPVISPPIRPNWTVGIGKTVLAGTKSNVPVLQQLTSPVVLPKPEGIYGPPVAAPKPIPNTRIAELRTEYNKKVIEQTKAGNAPGMNTLFDIVGGLTDSFKVITDTQRAIGASLPPPAAKNTPSWTQVDKPKIGTTKTGGTVQSTKTDRAKPPTQIKDAYESNETDWNDFYKAVLPGSTASASTGRVQTSNTQTIAQAKAEQAILRQTVKPVPPTTKTVTTTVSKTIANPAYAAWEAKYGDGSQIQTAATGGLITKNQLAAIQGVGPEAYQKPPVIEVPPPPPKTIVVQENVKKTVTVPGQEAPVPKTKQQSAPPPAPPPPTTHKGTATGTEYKTGEIRQTGVGNVYQAQENGTWKRIGNTTGESQAAAYEKAAARSVDRGTGGEGGNPTWW